MEISEMLKNTPELTLWGINTTKEEIEDLLQCGVKYKEFKRKYMESVTHE